MFERFYGLNEEKQNKILNAALEEFVKGGYDKASMNDLVKKAGISKGSLFYYFGNKRQLYFFLYEHCMEDLEAALNEDVDFQLPDIIERMRRYLKVNIEVLVTHPLVFEFIKSFKREKSKAVLEEIQRIIKCSPDLTSEVLSNEIDYSLFRKKVDVEKALHVMQSTIEGIIYEDLIYGDLSPGDVEKKLREYLDFFRDSFYI